MLADGKWQMANGKWVEIERRLADLRASPPISILQLGRKPLFKTGPMRHLRNFLSAVLVIGSLSAGLFVTGCGKSEPASQSTTGGDKKAKSAYTIGMSQCNLGEPWRVEMNAQIKAAADKQPKLKVIFKDAQNDTLKQRAHVEEFVGAGVDLIIISPKEAQPLTEPVGKAMDAHIPVIVLDRSLLGDKYTCFIGADNKKIGRAAGEWLVKKLGGKGKVVELKGLMTSTPGQDRNRGFREEACRFR